MPRVRVKKGAPERLTRSERGIDVAVRGMRNHAGLAKAHFIGRDVEPSKVKQPEDDLRDDKVFERAGSLAPPYDPLVLCKLFEHSNSLRQNVDAYTVNIDGNGHRFEPVIDLDADDAEEQVRDAMFLERLTEEEAAGGSLNVHPSDGIAPDFPADEEVEERLESMRDEMRLEKAKLDAFFRFCCVDESFISLRTKTRADREIMGNGYWEVLRNASGEPAQFSYVPAFTVRLLPLDKELVEVAQKVKRAPLTFEEITVRRRFRRYVQVFEGKKVYFKEFGDPRVVSARSGRVFRDRSAMEREEGVDDQPVVEASEIIHFAIHSPRTAYGIPRWIGTLLAVLGSRQSEEVNFLYFENKSVPPMAILVSGGRLTADSTKKIESFIENRIKGRTNFHKVMVIEAEPAEGAALDNASGRMKIEIVPLTMAQQQDALFQKYDERNIDKVGMAFRLPRLLRGDIRDFNRATAEAAMEFAETQVFAPEREAFDWLINRRLLSELGIKFWSFASNAPTTHNPLDLAEIVASLVKESILTPEEARELAKGIFNRDFKKIDEVWTKIPPELLKAGILPEGEGGEFLPPAPGEGGQEGDEEPVEGAEGDLRTGDLRERGGALVPSQGRPRRRRDRDKERTKLPRSLGKRYGDVSRSRALRKLARDLVDLRALLDAEEGAVAKVRLDESHDAEVEREVVQVSAEEFRALLGDAAE